MCREAEFAPALVEWLFDDPFYQAITADFEDMAARKQALAAYFAYSLAEARRTGRCVYSEPDLGAAAWLLPRTPDVEAAESSSKAACPAKSTWN